MVELSYRNAKRLQMERLRKLKKHEKSTTQQTLDGANASDLYLKAKPTHIECFDNSNIQGGNPVAACVVFKNGSPAKRIPPFQY